MQSFVTGDAAKSAAVTALKAGAALPLAGPMKNVFALWFASVPVSVPALVTGDPLTVKIALGSDSPTLVTVPEPEPQDCHCIAEPLVPKPCPFVPKLVRPVPPF